MVCVPVDFTDALGQPARAIVCRVPVSHTCGFCAAFCEVLCDFRLPKGKRCDARCCRSCATSVGEDLDLCPIHVRFRADFLAARAPAPAPAKSQLELFS